MTELFPILIVLALISDVVVGFMVVLTNPARSSNRGFAFMSAILALWLACMLMGAMSASEAAIEFWVRQTIAASLLTPMGIDALRRSVISGRFGAREAWHTACPWLPAWLPLAILCQTEIFIASVTPAVSRVHLVVYGPGFPIAALYMLGALSLLGLRFRRTQREAVGVQHEEIHFVLLGCLAGLGVGVAIWILWSVLRLPEMGRMLPLSVMVLHGVIAYGIATRRILGVRHILRRVTAQALLGLYLCLIYAAVYFAIRLRAGENSDRMGAAHILAAAVVVLSALPGSGVMQRFAARLFVTDQAVSPEWTIEKANAILQAVTTVDALLDHVSGLLRAAAGTDRVVVLLRARDGLVQRHPAVGQSGLRIRDEDPVVRALSGQAGPVVRDALRRRRPTPAVSELIGRLVELDAALILGIHSKGTLKGLVLLGPRLAGRSYDEVEQRTLLIVCDQLATALERAELYTELEHAKVYDETLLDSLSSGVVAADRSGLITVFNRAAQRMTGRGPDETLGRSVERLPPELAEPLKAALERRVERRDEEAMIHRGGNGSVPVRLSSSMFFNRSDDFLGAMLVLNDLSLVKQLEEQVRRTDQLSSLGTLAAGMAHEIKNPLVSIKAFTQLLPERYEDEEFRRTFFTLVGSEVERIDSIVNRLLNFSRPPASTLRPMSLHVTLDRALQLVEEPLRRKNVRLVRWLNSPDDRINGDPDSLCQVFLNFLLNAVQAMGEGGELDVATSRVTALDWVSSRRTTLGHPGIRVVIRDTGCGIAPEHLPRVFDPFFTSKSDGTGLGLSVAHRLLTEHGAIVEIRSTLGLGTTVDAVIPLLREEVTT